MISHLLKVIGVECITVSAQPKWAGKLHPIYNKLASAKVGCMVNIINLIFLPVIVSGRKEVNVGSGSVFSPCVCI